jgi:hypothetical protein
MTDFIEWHGSGACPVPLYSSVNIQVRNEELRDETISFHAHELDWEWSENDADYDIIGYRETVPQPSYILWSGGDNPAPNQVVEYALRGSSQFYITASENLDWSIEGTDSDIFSYRVYE